MQEIQNFNFNGSQVRALTIDNEPYFVGKDVAEILGYKNPSNALQTHVYKEDKTTYLNRVSGSNYKTKTTVINESGLYSLILSSKLPNAKQFKHWITSEVLPAIRKHGAYMTDKKAAAIVTDKNALADLLKQASDQLKAKDIQIEEMRPKALFADAVSASKQTVLIGELAKIMKGNGIEIGQNRLFAWLREHGYLISRKGTDYNMPTQKAMNLGLFKIKETTITHSDGHISVNKTPKVTGKGQQYFVNKFLTKAGV